MAVPLIGATQLDVPDVKPLGPLDAAAQALNLRTGQQNLQLNRIKLQQAAQAQKDEQDLRQAAQESAGDPDAMQNWLNVRNPRLAEVWAKGLAERRKSKADATKTELENADRQADILGRTIGSAKDQASYDTGLVQLESMFGPQIRQMVPAQFDPEAVKRIRDQALSVKDQIASQQKGSELATAALKAETDKGKESREARDAWTKTAHEFAAGAKSQQDLDRTNAYLQSIGAPKEVTALYSQFTPDTPDKANAALGRQPRVKSFEEQTFEDFLKNPALVKKYGNDRIAFDKYKQDQEIAKAAASKTAPEVPDLNDIVETTRNGRKYVPIANLTQKQKEVINTQASKAGIPVVDKDTGEMLKDLDTARANQEFMLKAIESKLPKDALGRVVVGPANKAMQISQLDPDLAATGTFRNAAIQSMRALAGSRGLRINRAEIEMAQQNDIPQPTDTVETARKKLSNILTLLDNTEKAHLTRDRSAAGAGAAQSGGLDAVLDKVFGPAPTKK